jgi:hypothetical protein
MKNKKMIVAVIAMMTLTAKAEQSFAFKSPQFNGNGYSSHVQTIENTEYSRQQTIIAAQKQAAIDAATAAGNTTLAKFLNNFESRVYAQLSTQLVNNLFGENPQTSGTLNLEGNTIKYTKTTDQISLTVTDPTGNITQVVIPVGTFGLN